MIMHMRTFSESYDKAKIFSYDQEDIVLIENRCHSKVRQVWDVMNRHVMDVKLIQLLDNRTGNQKAVYMKGKIADWENDTEIFLYKESICRLCFEAECYHWDLDEVEIFKDIFNQNGFKDITRGDYNKIMYKRTGSMWYLTRH